MGGNTAKVARTDLEKKLNRSVITSENNLNYKYIDNINPSMKVPNDRLISAMEEVEAIESGKVKAKKYKSFEEILDDGNK